MQKHIPSDVRLHALLAGITVLSSESLSVKTWSAHAIEQAKSLLLFICNLAVTVVKLSNKTQIANAHCKPSLGAAVTSARILDVAETIFSFYY